jgi:DNA-3-methyladenine glycosylase II|tara:strand:+ start:4782 stop:5399 length:618 start_codon:yes stop_codon:yes gene_type:complete
MKPKWWNKGKSHLSRRDKVIKKLLRVYKGHLTSRNNFFYSLCRSIISQQISVSAADSVFLKFEKKCKSKIKPKTISKLSISDLRKCGLSRMKAKGIKSLAEKILNKSFDPKLIKKMSDEDAINYLSSLRQIGRWSSEMVLIFFYNRPNIWPVQDIGLLRAISNNYHKKYLPPKSFVKKLQKKFSPFCTLAVMALWYSVDNEPVQY